MMRTAQGSVLAWLKGSMVAWGERCPLAVKPRSPASHDWIRLVLVVLWAGRVMVALGQERLAISEIMYHPVEEPAFTTNGLPVLDLYEDVHEYVELHNWGDQPVALGGWQVTGGIGFTFTKEASLGPGQYLVVAKNPDRLRAVAAYGLAPGQVQGPYVGELSNTGETIELRNPAGQVVDEVRYSARFPWPLGADALGAEEEWTGLKATNYQYCGRSLERVSFQHSGSDPANWLASPPRGTPSPGRPNAVQRAEPKPIVVQLSALQVNEGRVLIRGNEPVKIEALFSATNHLSAPSVEYFVDNIEATNETHRSVPMLASGRVGEARFGAQLPGLPVRSVVRYRLHADRGEGDEVVSPRADDPLTWHAYFVTPVRTRTNAAYDVFISAASLRILTTNITRNPRRVTTPDPPGWPRASWNATQPAVFVADGVVYDVQMRHHGSQFRRDPGRRSYKLQFPRFQRFHHRASIFLTDKDARTAGGHALFRAVGLPSSRTRWIDLYLGTATVLTRLEQEECDDFLLEDFHREQHRLHPDQLREEVGELYKSQGVFDQATGPYGPGSGRQLAARPPYWTSLQRYEWTFGLQDHGWRGPAVLKDLIDAMWTARNGRTTLTTNEAQNLRRSWGPNWNLDRALTHIALFNWMGVWDDVIHNYFLWRQRDGRWALLPWDFDSTLDGASTSVSIFNGAPNAGPNYFKESLVAAYREEFRQRAWWLNNTVLHPTNLPSLGLSSAAVAWARTRLTAVNTQLGLGPFQRPERPVHLAPGHNRPLAPAGWLRTSAYRHTVTHPVPPHATTLWVIRSPSGDYSSPRWQLTSSNYLQALPAMLADLEPGKTYYWRCQHLDTNGHPSLFSAETAFVYGQADRGTNGVVLNEIMADNRSTVRNGSRYPDWVELFNPGDQDQNLDNFTLTDDLLDPAKYAFPLGTVVPAHGYLTLWCDSATTSPGLHTGFGLSAGGETLALYRSTPEGCVVQDLVRFGLQLPDLSVGRVPDGSGPWRLTQPSFRDPNQPHAVGQTGRLRLNEWMAHPSVGDDWLELYNPEAEPVALAGLALTDDFANPTNTVLGPLSFIAARGFVKLVADGNARNGPTHLDFRLAADGGALGLYQTNGVAIDTVLYGWHGLDVAEGRLPDGAVTCYLFPGRATPGGSNDVDYDFDGLPDAWELATGLALNQPGQAWLDPDGDGLSNALEYQAGTDPLDPQSLPRLESLRLLPDSRLVVLGFQAAAGRAYVIEGGSTWDPYGWQVLVEISPQPGPRPVEQVVPLADGSKAQFYRLRVSLP